MFSLTGLMMPTYRTLRSCGAMRIHFQPVAVTDGIPPISIIGAAFFARRDGLPAWVLEFLQTSNFKLQASNFKLQTSSFKLQTSNFKLQASNFKSNCSFAVTSFTW